MILADVIIPVILIAGAGFVFARVTHSDARTLTRLSFYILTPSLIFDSMLNQSISMADLAEAGLFVLMIHGLLTLVAVLGVRRTSWDSDTRTSAILSFSFNNCGNYGLPVLLFAFGDAGFSLGVVYMVAHMVYQIVFGVGVASWRKGMSIRNLVATIFKVPWLYAFGLAMAVRLLPLELPVALARPVELVAGAAIPVQLLLLGASLAGVRIGGVFRQAVPISLAKLVIPPLLAWGAAAILGTSGLLRSVLILQASTPTAINALILSLQFERRSELTASIVMLTTLGGLGVTTLLLWLLG